MKERKEDQHDNLERWLITYSDLITLLLALFIMMYTVSRQDAQKYHEAAGQLKTIFSGRSAVLNTGPGAGSNAAIPLLKTEPQVAQQLEKEVQGMAEAKDAGHKISVLSDERGIVIRVMDRAFFDTGKADLKDTARTALMKIAPILKASHNQIMIEGHTDNVPINTTEFTSNWELSVRRATEVVRYLIETYGFPPGRISASGYAEYRPVAPNDSGENRALNRRIEIILLRPSISDPAVPSAGS
jgi:chemotaxis protein MotB